MRTRTWAPPSVDSTHNLSVCAKHWDAHVRDGFALHLRVSNGLTRACAPSALVRIFFLSLTSPVQSKAGQHRKSIFETALGFVPSVLFLQRLAHVLLPCFNERVLQWIPFGNTVYIASFRICGGPVKVQCTCVSHLQWTRFISSTVYFPLTMKTGVSGLLPSLLRREKSLTLRQSF